jgi:hypothetical protein
LDPQIIPIKIQPPWKTIVPGTVRWRAAPPLFIGAKKQLFGPNEQDGMQPVL